MCLAGTWIRRLEKHIAWALCLREQCQDLMNKETLADLGHSLGKKHKYKFQQINFCSWVPSQSSHRAGREVGTSSGTWGWWECLWERPVLCLFLRSLGVPQLLIFGFLLFSSNTSYRQVILLPEELSGTCELRRELNSQSNQRGKP